MRIITYKCLFAVFLTRAFFPAPAPVCQEHPKPLAGQPLGAHLAQTGCVRDIAELWHWLSMLTQIKYLQSVLKVNLNGREQKKLVNQIKHNIMLLELLDAPKAIPRCCSLRTHFKLNSQIANGQRSSTQDTSSQTRSYQRCLWNKHTCNLLSMSNLGKRHSTPMFKFLNKHRKRCHKSALSPPGSRIVRSMLVQSTFQHGLWKENGSWGNDNSVITHSKTVS